MTKLRAEHELLLCIARKSLDEDVGDRVRRLVQQNIDWEYLIQSASAHGLLPLLATHLLNTAQPFLPEPIAQQLKTESINSSKSNIYLMGELLRIQELFRAEKIRMLAFKGPILSKQIYGDLGLRQAGDIDVLIPKQDFARAKELLESDRYQMEPQLTSAQQRSHLRFHCEIQFFNEDAFCVVDLHWGLTPRSFPFPLAFEELWAQRNSINFAGHEIQTFSDQDLLLYLCVHAAKHYWGKLEWVASVAELVRRTETLKWSAVFRRAEETNSKRILSLGLLLASKLFQLELPRELDDWLKQSQDMRECALLLEENLFQNTVEHPSQIEMFRWNLQFMDRKQDAMTSLLRSVFVPTLSDWQGVELRGPLYPLYFGVRPIRLLMKYGRAKE
ncbi:MAG TPA: nucleotidyltransferase family protein [Pyrinomonadaceae bacterium]|nr:nucleotidyltransferase family protein [Pyrinomonadaceae bacterium]